MAGWDVSPPGQCLATVLEWELMNDWFFGRICYMKRPGGQSQFSELLQSQTTDSPVFDELHLWMAKNLHDQKLIVDKLARQVNMSPRNFARSYKTKTG
jgi:transcriptional regulator GlxA family with amidase domain